jgi:type II secretory ATPase GspE/PulE/Tfp pilus assembly ATPase PilB-like protein
VSIELQVQGWIQSAVERGASDIHIEPEAEDRIRVRMRVDGQCHLHATITDAKRVLACVKVMATLDPNEHSKPLDGRISWEGQNGRKVDLRLSTLPCLGGEKIVLRLIDNRRLDKGLPDLGFTKRMLALYEPLLGSPNGLFLHVGPTGSGKTTSLYAALRAMNKPELNVQTVEDPVEYHIGGITQTQVNYELGLDFPKVLRSLLRQDPNVILVGEIRDDETAEIAVEAAMTGHVVLSTLHTNDAVGSVARLLDMGIASYGIAYALRCVVSQRFAQRLCERCRRRLEPTDKLAALLGPGRACFEASEGCRECRGGFDGRIPLFEIMPGSAALRKAIHQNRAPDELQAIAMQNGMITMFQDGIEKVGAGLTTIEELFRLTKGLKATTTPAGAPARPAAPAKAPAAAPRPAGARPAARPPGPRRPPTRPSAPPR